jgi:type IV secretory pathway TrbL component
MEERRAVGILLIIMFIFIIALRRIQEVNLLSENYLDVFIVGFFLVVIFLWQYISPSQKKKKEQEGGEE